MAIQQVFKFVSFGILCVLFQILRSGSPRNFAGFPPRSRDMTSLKHHFLKISRRVLPKFSEVTWKPFWAMSFMLHVNNRYSRFSVTRRFGVMKTVVHGEGEGSLSTIPPSKWRLITVWRNTLWGYIWTKNVHTYISWLFNHLDASPGP